MSVCLCCQPSGLKTLIFMSVPFSTCKVMLPQGTLSNRSCGTNPLHQCSENLQKLLSLSRLCQGCFRSYTTDFRWKCGSEHRQILENYFSRLLCIKRSDGLSINGQMSIPCFLFEYRMGALNIKKHHSEISFNQFY